MHSDMLEYASSGGVGTSPPTLSAQETNSLSPTDIFPERTAAVSVASMLARIGYQPALAHALRLGRGAATQTLKAAHHL